MQISYRVGLVEGLTKFIGTAMNQKYEALEEKLALQENIIVKALLEIEVQVDILVEMQNLFKRCDKKLVPHFEPKQQVLRILKRFMNDTVIMIQNDTLENFLVNKEEY